MTTIGPATPLSSDDALQIFSRCLPIVSLVYDGGNGIVHPKISRYLPSKCSPSVSFDDMDLKLGMHVYLLVLFHIYSIFGKGDKFLVMFLFI